MKKPDHVQRNQNSGYTILKQWAEKRGHWEWCPTWQEGSACKCGLDEAIEQISQLLAEEDVHRKAVGYLGGISPWD